MRFAERRRGVAQCEEASMQTVRESAKREPRGKSCPFVIGPVSGQAGPELAVTSSPFVPYSGRAETEGGDPWSLVTRGPKALM